MLLFWIVLCLDFRRGWPRHLVLPDDPPPTAQEGQGRELAVVIPARNEAQTLRRPFRLSWSNPKITPGWSSSMTAPGMGPGLSPGS